MRALHFDDDLPWIPSRAWAQAWQKNAESYWLQFLHDYRDRVHRYHGEQLLDRPQSFPFMHPTRVLTIGSLARIWTFAGPHDGTGDVVVTQQRWEDEVLAVNDINDAPNHERTARLAAEVPEAYEMIDSLPAYSMTPVDNPKTDTPGNPYEGRRITGLAVPGARLADTHASNADFDNAFEGLSSRSIHRAKLRTLKSQLGVLRQLTNPQARGLQLEGLIEELFAAHGCQVERGRHRPGEQVDILVHRPFRALVECRWLRKPLDRGAITELIGKLTRDRPSIVSGIYISMSGFTANAKTESVSHARDRVVVLLDAADIDVLISGRVHVADVIDERIDDIVRRY